MEMLNVFYMSAIMPDPCLHGAFELMTDTETNQIISQISINLATGKVSIQRIKLIANKKVRENPMQLADFGFREVSKINVASRRSE